MFTKENYRGQGIATNLLTKLVDEAKLRVFQEFGLGLQKWVDRIKEVWF